MWKLPRLILCLLETPNLSPSSEMGRNANPGHFAKTSWNRVQRAAGANSAESETALVWLCERYWYPLYAYSRRSGLPPHDAEDATQAFFAHLLEGGILAKADPQRGRFRSFLLTAFVNHQRQRREHDAAWKRGGRHEHLSLDSLTAEDRYRHEPTDHRDPARLYESAWAETVIQRGIERLRAEYCRLGKADLFEALVPRLSGESASQSENADRLGMSSGAARVALHRMRVRFSHLLREEVADTLDGRLEVEDELLHINRTLATRQ